MANPNQAAMQRADAGLRRDGEVDRQGSRQKRYLEAGCRLRVYSVGMEIVMDWTLPRSMDKEAMELSILYTLARQEGVPRCCVALVWGGPKSSIDKDIIAQLVITQLTQEEEYRWDDYADECSKRSEPLCFACYDPCEDADFPSRCVVCEPCSLCDECSVQGSWGQPLCLQCVTEFPREFARLDTRARRRLMLVREDQRKTETTAEGSNQEDSTCRSSEENQ